MNHPLNDMMTATMGKIREMIDVNTVIGNPINTPDGVTIIPVTKVSIGYGSGGTDFATKNYPPNKDNAFGGGAGAGINITPVAFLIIRGESVRMLPVAEPASTSVDRIIEMLPDLLDRADEFLADRKKKKEEKESEA
jgi:sporulation protein YtfJ